MLNTTSKCLQRVQRSKGGKLTEQRPIACERRSSKTAPPAVEQTRPDSNSRSQVRKKNWSITGTAFSMLMNPKSSVAFRVSRTVAASQEFPPRDKCTDPCIAEGRTTKLEFTS
ncbi:hypothetical protein BC835DRAFT_1007924 [Cytidiella melzeri]|nr:hypothetical protein BC835DRAFT_1007924 [Cytidiella melzeri]